jgi:elongator complex protein 3
MRAILNEFDPYKQIKMRLRALKTNGHKTDKVELIIMGGTWSCHSHQYQNWYIKRCFEALNGRKAKSLESAKKSNEKAKHRCVGLTLETRPDYIDEKEIIRMRKFGCTRVELGIQHTDDQVLKLNKRGHDSKKSKEAIKLLKEAGFKLNLHLMVNLPGSTMAKDFKMFKELYTSSNWMPDMIKIYPCVVHEDALLYKWYSQGKYKPYTDKQLLELLKKIKKITPEYVRITRLIRDIPEESIVAGNKITNLRQIINDQAKHEGWSCKCIRCREVSRQETDDKKPKLKIRKYKSSGGDEYFLSYESPDEKVLYAFLRLRISDVLSNFISELSGAGLIREVHTYGKLTSIGEKGKIQHIGLGKKLLEEAQIIVAKNKINKIAVISGIGVREYYKKNGYKLEGTYMTKNII